MSPKAPSQCLSSTDDSFSSPSIQCVLPGYQAQPKDDGAKHSLSKLQRAARELNEFVPRDILRIQPCESEAETWGYRCTCSFQMVEDADGELHYAMRSKNEPVLLQAKLFPIANRRIQSAMEKLLDFLQDDGVTSIRENLASVTFASSWCDSPSSDCFVTLNYDRPMEDETMWKLFAMQLCNSARFTHVTGRSKKKMVTVKGDNRIRTSGHIRDIVWLSIPNNDDLPIQASFENDSVNNQEQIPVPYRKPETAFFHPNAYVMLQALEWMLSRISLINSQHGHIRMLEMYCGCGAHTVALAKARLLDLIVAVEWDARLVDACEANCRANNCYQTPDQWQQVSEISGTNESSLRKTENTTPVFLFKGDASEWARKSLQRQNQENDMPPSESSWHSFPYDVLLVDPPRSGLGSKVCDMALDGPFKHLLYISCGRDALKLDLDHLHPQFQVLDCKLLDLFPRTDAVESLVHLQRVDRTMVYENHAL